MASFSNSSYARGEAPDLPPPGASSSSSSSSSASAPKSYGPPRKLKVTEASATSWLSRVADKQKQHLTPEVRARIKRKAARLQRVQRQARKCKKMQSYTRSSKAAWSSAMTRMSEVSLTPNLSAAAAASAQRAAVTDSCLSMTAVQANLRQLSNESDEDELFRYTPALPPPAPSADGEGKSGDGSDLLALAEDLEVDASALAAEDAAEAAEEAEEVQQDEMEALLAQLRQEPATDAERESKFKLYEVYLETVSQLRAETFAFWEESKAEFEGEAGGAVQGVEHALSRLDRHGNMGFPDFDSPVWFVYGMCKKAADNSSQIDSVLRSIRTKLELLGRQDECPICLEPFDAEHRPQVLSCCHKVCDECWNNWKAVRRNRVFCPLCRNDEFYEDVMQMQQRGFNGIAFE